ncbi:MAG: response regulator [Anaerolineae bacterium]|nr:response regulator [Anaerolineae bacterium]
MLRGLSFHARLSIRYSISFSIHKYIKTMAEKILIVDDDIDSLKLIGLMLQRQGYEISAASSGAQALTKASGEMPNLIILDVMMPDMDGYEVCRQLRANSNTQNIPIIMFTAKTMVDDKVAGFEAGADDYLTKPTHPAELASRVKAVLARSAAKQSKAQDSGSILVVLGAKGGVGTTTVAANLAAALQDKYSPILTDIRFGQGSLGISLGIKRAGGFANLLTRPAGDVNARTVGSEIITHHTGLRLLLSSTRPREAQLNPTPDTVANILRHLRSMTRLIIVDLGTGLSPLNQRILRDASHVVVTVEPHRITLGMARALLHDLEELGVGQAKISVVMLNRTQSSLQIAWQEAEQILERDIQGVIPPAPELAFQANEAGEAIINLQPEAIVATQFGKLADTIATQIGVAETE